MSLQALKPDLRERGVVRLVQIVNHFLFQCVSAKVPVVRTLFYYLMGTLIGVALVALFFNLNPNGLQALKAQGVKAVAVADRNAESGDEAVTRSRRNAITRSVGEASPAVVGINVIAVREYRYRSPFYLDPFFRQMFPDQVYRKHVENLGSGFIISPDGYVLTNQHVVEEATKVVVTKTSGEKFDADIIGADRDNDLALLKINGQNLPYIRFGNSDEVIIGEWAIAIGNPFGLFSIHSQPTVTVGVVSAVDRDFERNEEGRLYQDMIQTDAAINRGNSGGPLINSIGELIGMNTMIFTEGGGSIGLGFAIPSNKLKTLVEELKVSGSIDRDFWTGLHVQDLNRVIAMSLRLPDLKGVVITDIDPGSPSQKAGLEPTDVIVSVNGKAVSNTAEIDQVLKNIDLRVGDKIRLTVLRGGKKIESTVKLEKKG